MLGLGNNDEFKTWSEEQRRIEIGNLVKGYQNGLPVEFLCEVAITIAGSAPQAKEHFSALLSQKERESIVVKEAGQDAKLRARLTEVLL